MSELNSLFLKLRIKKDKLDEFLQSKPDQPILDSNWTEWWNSRKMYGSNKLSESNIYCYEEKDNQSIVENWKNEKHSVTFSDYNAQNEIWCFGIVFFSENYFEMVPGLAFVKSMANFIEYDKDNFAIIFDFFWGGNEVNAYMNFKENMAFLDAKAQNKVDVNAQHFNFAKDYLSKRMDEFSEDCDD